MVYEVGTGPARGRYTSNDNMFRKAAINYSYNDIRIEYMYSLFEESNIKLSSIRIINLHNLLIVPSFRLGNVNLLKFSVLGELISKTKS